MKVYCNEYLIASNVKKADTYITRLVGLLNRKSITINDGLLLTNSSSIHCFFMKFSIDVIYLSKDMEVLYIETVQPWKMGKIVKKTKHVLEIHEGAAHNIKKGDFLEFINQ